MPIPIKEVVVTLVNESKTCILTLQEIYTGQNPTEFHTVGFSTFDGFTSNMIHSFAYTDNLTAETEINFRVGRIMN